MLIDWDDNKRHLKISFLLKISEDMNATYTVATGLVDRKREIRKYYVLENEKSWRKGEIDDLVDIFERSRAVQGFPLGTIVCSPDITEGYSKIFSFDNRNHSLRSCLCIRNINQEIQQGKYAILLTPAEKAITDFDQDLLVEEGLKAFKTEWCDRTRFV